MIRRDYRSGPSIELLEPRRLLSLTPLGPEVTVPMPTVMSQFDMAVGGDGSFIVVGDPIEQPGSPDVIAVRYGADGQQIGQPLTLDDRGFNVSVSMDADGDAIVAYQKGSDGVYVVRVSKDGIAGAPQRVGTAPEGQKIWDTAVSMDDAGGFFVTWVQRQPDTIEVRAFDAAGQPRGPQFVAAPPSSPYTRRDLEIDARPDGSSAAIAHLSETEGGESAVFWRVSTTGRIGGLGSVGRGAFQLDPDVAVHADGSFAIGYGQASGVGLGHSFDSSTRFAAYVDRFDANGQHVGTSQVGESLPGGSDDKDIDRVSVDALPDGGFLASFVQDLDGAVTTYAQRFNAAGVSVAGPIAVDEDPARLAVIGAAADGAAVLAYLQGPFSGFAESGDIHVRRLSLAPFAELRGAELFVEGTEGNDHIIVERVRDRLWVNVNGVVEGFNAADVQFLSINGFGGDDDIDNNTPLPSTIHGGDGHDTIWGGSGDDRILGLGGNDFLRGGDGNDTVFGGNGSDSLNGGDGNDDLSGDAGEDMLYGAVGNDVLYGHRGSDRLYGEAGNDTLDGGAGGDYLEGGAGHEALIGGGEADALFGLAGNDRFLAAGDGIRDTVRGGPGTDTAEADQDDDVLAVEIT